MKEGDPIMKLFRVPQPAFMQGGIMTDSVDLEERSVPLAPLKIVYLPGCAQMARAIDNQIVRIRNTSSEQVRSPSPETISFFPSVCCP